MTELLRQAMEHSVSRRKFLGWSAAAAGAVTVGLQQFGLTRVGSGAASAAPMAPEGKWVAAGCWHNCGGRCVNKVLVRNGVVIRQKTDDSHPDSPDYPQQRACLRGRSQRQQVLGADRLKYPMKRKNWAPGGGKKELRGRDEWVRISWDEALDIVAGEIKRAMDAGGNKAILAGRINSPLLNAMGGCLTSWGVTSEGAWPAVERTMYASYPPSVSDRLDWRNTKLLVVWGQNQAWASMGLPAYNLLQVKKAGARIIFVDPMLGATHQALADQWIPVRPSTDTALLLGMAYHMITNNLQDQEFLDKYTVGFDAAHMPPGVDSRENFKDYVLGTFDGVPKTPEWASEICGTDPRVIRQFATEVASTKPSIWTTSAAAARTNLGQQFCQAYLTVGWMTGNVGFSGAGVWMSYHNRATFGSRALVTSGGAGVPSSPNPLHPYATYAFLDAKKDNWYGMAYEEVYDAILNGEYTLGWRGKTKCDIKMIYSLRTGSGGNFLNQSAGINKGIKAMRKVDFIVTSDIVLSTISKYADVVLPECSMWEKAGQVMPGNPEAIFAQSQVIEPLYECREGTWMERELAKRLGVNLDKVHPVPTKQQYFNQIAGSKVIKPDGSGMETLVTITEADIAQWGVKGKPQQGRITLQEFLDRGGYQVERKAGDRLGFIAYKAFREDPVKNKLGTSTGKLEIHCKALSELIAAYGFTTCPPIAQYRPPVDGYEATFKDLSKKEKGDYPLQMTCIHYPRRSHSVLDNVRWLREAFPQEVFMNPVDAAARGIQSGDTIKVFNQYGAVIRPVYVTERIMPGVIITGEGAWVDLDETTGIDRAGATNSLTRTMLTGQGEEPWNTVVVQVEKWGGPPLPPDVTWPQRIVF